MYRSPKFLVVLPILMAGTALPAIALQVQSPPGAQPPNSPTQVQNPAPGQPLPEQTPPDSRTPVATPAPTSPTGVLSGQSPATQVPGSSSSTLPPPPKSPVEPSLGVTETSGPPLQPKTELLDTSDTAGALATDGHDPYLDPPPFPKGQTTMIGGIISSVDRVRNHLNVAVFGGGHWTVYFDERTHIFRKGIETTQMALKKGERIYIDTMLDNNRHDVFARNIRMGIVTAPADASGQIVAVNDKRREVTFRDYIGGETVHFSVAPDALISKGSTPASFQDLRTGSLVKVKFAPERADRGVAREISILASPGASFTFYGTVTFLDTHRGILAIHTPADNKTYDVHFLPQMDPGRRLAVGAEVQTIATFDGAQYTARQITITRMAGEQPK